MITLSRSFKLGLVSAILSLLVLAYAAHAQQSYPMTCRGGGKLTIVNDGSNGVRIKFQPGKGAAPAGLAPGQCTWSDRALRPGEPNTICDNSARAAQYVGSLVQPDQYVILQVHNDGRGCMRVTGVGP
jgi:hypothetical protein